MKRFNEFVLTARKGIARMAHRAFLAACVGGAFLGAGLARAAGELDPATAPAWDLSALQTTIAPYVVLVLAGMATVIGIVILPRLLVWGYRRIAALFGR